MHFFQIKSAMFSTELCLCMFIFCILDLGLYIKSVTVNTCSFMFECFYRTEFHETLLAELKNIIASL